MDYKQMYFEMEGKYKDILHEFEEMISQRNELAERISIIGARLDEAIDMLKESEEKLLKARAFYKAHNVDFDAVSESKEYSSPEIKTCKVTPIEHESLCI